MDDIDRQILTILAEDARASLKMLSAQVGLSSPSTSERLRRLEESGVIQGYTLNVNLQAVGYAFESLVRIKPLPGMLKKVEQLIQAIPEVVECDKVTGEDCFIVLGDVIQLHRARFLRQAQRDLFDHLMARIGDGVHRVPEANHHLFVVDAAANVGFRFVRRFIALLDLQRHLVGAAVLRPAQRANGANDRRIDVGSGAGDHPAGEGRGVEFMLGVQDQ